MSAVGVVIEMLRILAGLARRRRRDASRNVTADAIRVWRVGEDGVARPVNPGEPEQAAKPTGRVER